MMYEELVAFYNEVCALPRPEVDRAAAGPNAQPGDVPSARIRGLTGGGSRKLPWRPSGSHGVVSITVACPRPTFARAVTLSVSLVVALDLDAVIRASPRRKHLL